MSKRRNDIILTAVLLLAAVAGLLLFKTLSRQGDFAVVLINGEETARFPLDTDTEFVIETDGGVNTLVIADGKAYIKEANCPDGICVDHTPISRIGETITCLPHGVVVTVKSEKASDTGLDMVA
ncbi:MAG: NusG domain II-containing protein [Clostridia bacterium]|nr:NusG domain II-containing protein [Clostridia bacterium]